jgi:hypothetical protein
VPFHDPRREVEKLRDHLAAHDKPIAFLIGAGASCSVRDSDGKPLDPPLVPAIAALGGRCAEAVKALGDEHETAYRQMAKDVNPTSSANVEDILSRVRLMIAAMTDADKLANAERADLKRIEETMRRTIARTALPEETRIPARMPHHSLARWIGRIDRTCAVELFTTNYDTLLERALEDERVPVFDGFVGSRRPFFSAASLLHEESAPGRYWTRVWKYTAR